MAKLLKLRRGTTTQHASFTGAEGELTIDTTKDTAVVHDGTTQSGHTLLREDMSNLPAGTIDNADVNASAAISGTKISPDFGSQTITTTGKVLFANVYSNESDLPSASTYHGMFAHVHSTGLAYFAHAGNWIKLAPLNAPDFTGGIDVSGNISVTGTVDGRDVAADGTKLDGIESGSTGDQTPAEILTAIKTVDGSGSGLDADTLDGAQPSTGASNNTIVQRNSSGFIYANYINTTDNSLSTNVSGIICKESGQGDFHRTATAGAVRSFINVEDGATADQTKSDIDGLNINADQVDGLHAASFIRSDAADTASGDILFSGGAGAVSIAANSDIRLDNGNWTGETSAKIQHHSNNLYLQYPDAGTLRIRDSAGNDNVTIDTSGNLTASGNVTAFSDARLKTDISTINDALGICGKLRGVSYKWLKDGSAGIGVIAQEVEEVIPEVVVTNVDTNPSTGETTEIKSVDYGKIVGVLINAINELKAEVDELKGGK